MTAIGTMEKLELDISKPIPMKMEMEMRRLHILLGMNATGKSFVLKTQFAMGTAMAAIIARKPPGAKPLLSKEPPDIRPQITGVSEEELVQHVFDSTYFDNDLTGSVVGMWENGSLFTTFEEGKLKDMSSEHAGVDVPTPSIFMSAELRLFSSINRYLQLYNSLENKEDILKSYRLYDVMYVEKIKQQVGSGYDFDKATQATINDMLDGTHLKVGQITQDDNGFYMNGRNLAAYSNGEQAILNMMLGAGR